MDRIISGICSVGIILIGNATIVPNIMIADSGKIRARRASSIGLKASCMFILTGIYGLCVSMFVPTYIKHIPIGFLLSLGVQILAFLMM